MIYYSCGVFKGHDQMQAASDMEVFQNGVPLKMDRSYMENPIEMDYYFWEAPWIGHINNKITSDI